ncbi:hypothetical protein JKA74_00335 [Marivirga sp. S37H4]|uniref:DUF5689 domain-containing protein n=1 Tax=Marivirga aurantiaca TaxID=2802615 RepID=A0A934WUW1_9BACT|nr:hypothetical protein [Marivirga aurantiaca]MBK6263463.1 hypothetical protein [Marivirga aurantiaca]
MKNILYVFLLSAIVFAGCTEPENLVTGTAQEGAFLSLSGSGSLAGAPAPGVELEDATISFQATILDYNVKVSSDASVVDELVAYKSFGGEVVEISRTSASSDEGLSVNYETIGDFLSGFSGVASSDLRVGDQISFYTEIVMKDGRVLVDKEATLNINVSCLADLTGTYLVTNTWCAPSFTVEITQNADGSYYLPVADGGGLSKCTANTTLPNYGSIIEQCGEILPTDELQYGTGGSGNAIGDITGGSWDAENGIITLQHTQGFTANWPSEWESTYTRQ